MTYVLSWVNHAHDFVSLFRVEGFTVEHVGLLFRGDPLDGVF